MHLGDGFTIGLSQPSTWAARRNLTGLFEASGVMRNHLPLFLWWMLMMAAAQAQDAAVSGVVRDATTLRGLGGARVEISDPRQRFSDAALASADGVFRFGHLRPGEYTLRCKLEGYLDSTIGTFSRYVKLTSAKEERVMIDLTAASSVEGVLHDEDGQPMEGIDVYVNASLRATTAKDGTFTIDNLGPRTYQIAFRIPFATRRKSLQKNDKGEVFGYTGTMYYPGISDPQTAMPVTALAGLTLRGFEVRLRRVPLVKLSGRVIEGSTGVELQDARVWLEMPPNRFLDDALQARVLDADGGFRFETIPPGRYSLMISRGTDKDALPWVSPVDVGKSGADTLKVVVPAFPVLEGTI